MKEIPVTAWAPGKVILLGEHFVVHGAPAIATALDQGTEVAVRSLPGPEIRLGGGEGHAEISKRMLRAIMRELGAGEDAGIEVDVRSEIPSAAGLGASAAFSVAAVRALSGLGAGLGWMGDEGLPAREITDQDVFRIALEAEKVAHGTPSGIDPFLATYRGLVWFEKGPPLRSEPIAAPDAMDLVVGLTEERGDTAEMVARVRALGKRHEARFSALVEAAGRLVAEGREALGRADADRLGEIMNMNHGLLSAIEVSTGPLEELVAAARAAGAAGAKLTGAGGGGAMIALCPGCADEVHRALERAGAGPIIRTKIESRPVRPAT